MPLFGGRKEGIVAGHRDGDGGNRHGVLFSCCLPRDEVTFAASSPSSPDELESDKSDDDEEDDENNDEEDDENNDEEDDEDGEDEHSGRIFIVGLAWVFHHCWSLKMKSMHINQAPPSTSVLKNFDFS